MTLSTAEEARSSNDIDPLDEIARAKQQISEIVWYMPLEQALGILADIALRVIRKTFDGEDAIGAAKIFCDEVVHAVEQVNHRSR